MNRRSFIAFPFAARAASAQLETRVLRSLETVEAIDTHEHLLPELERVKSPIDFFTLASHYALHDAVSAGLPAEARAAIERPTTPSLEKWRLFEPYWRSVQFTGYGQALRLAVREIYGLEIGAAHIDRINQAIAIRNKVGLYRDILKKRARLRFCVNDEYWQPAPQRPDPEFFVLARKFDEFVLPITAAGVQRLETASGRSITTLQDLKEALEKQFERALAAGMVAVKSTAAYYRDLRFDAVEPAVAEREFERLMQERSVPQPGYEALAARPYRQLANHMMHHLVRLAAAHSMPFQFHTGLHAGNANIVTNSKPSDLTNLFFLYPNVQFDLFHIGFPYHHETAVLAKLFPNVYVDFCWMHIVSPVAARAALDEMLDTVPANKIFGFGGDYRYPELSYAHLLIARRNIASVLAKRVASRGMSETEAAEVGRWLLHDNPARLFAPRRRASN